MSGSGERVDQSVEAPVCHGHLFEVFAVLGKRWNGLIIGALLNRPARFGELQRAIPGLRGPMLSTRLAELAKAGLVEREVEEGPPVAVHYRLTGAGEALRPSIGELTAWARTWLPSATDDRPAG